MNAQDDMITANGPHLVIRFQGGDADNHRVRLRYLGESPMGMERLIAVGLYYLLSRLVGFRGETNVCRLWFTHPHQGAALWTLALGSPKVQYSYY